MHCPCFCWGGLAVGIVWRCIVLWIVGARRLPLLLLRSRLLASEWPCGSGTCCGMPRVSYLFVLVLVMGLRCVILHYPQLRGLIGPFCDCNVVSSHGRPFTYTVVRLAARTVLSKLLPVVAAPFGGWRGWICALSITGSTSRWVGRLVAGLSLRTPT